MCHDYNLVFILMFAILELWLIKQLIKCMQFVGLLLLVDLITLVGLKCPYVGPSTKSFFDFNEIWYIVRGRWVMHDGMQYDPTQGQGEGHEPLKVGNLTVFKGYLLPHL